MTQENIGNLVEFSTCQQKPTCQCRRHRRCRFHPWVGKIPWSRKWQPTPVLLPGESHGQRNLAGYSPWGCKESNLTEHALKGPSLSLAVSSEFLARVSCPSPWRSRTTWDISQSKDHTNLWHLWELLLSLPKLILWSKAQLQRPHSLTVNWGSIHCFQENSTRLPIFANYGRITDNFAFLIYTLLFPKTQRINIVFITRKCNKSFSLKKQETHFWVMFVRGRLFFSNKNQMFLGKIHFN